MDSTRKDLTRCLEKVSSLLDDLSLACDGLFDDRETLETEISGLRYALEQAQEYYMATRNELKLLLGLCADNRLELPLTEHFMDINDLVPETDPQRGQYDGIWLDESFAWYV